MSNPTSVASERGVWFFAETVTLSKDPGDDGDLVFSQGEQNENGQVVSGDVIGTLPVLTRDKYDWDFSVASGKGAVTEDECSKAFMPSPGSCLPELGEGRQIRYMEMSVMDPDNTPSANQNQYLKECDGVLLTEPRPGDRPVHGSWWAFHGGVHIEDEPQGDSCVITFGHDTEFRLCTGLKVRDRLLKTVNNSRSNFSVLDHVHHWVENGLGNNPSDAPDQGTQIQFRLSEDRTVRCSHSANHWRSLSFQDKEDGNFFIESVWFAPNRDSRGDAESGDNDGGASGDDGQGSVKGTAVYLVGPYTGYVNASRRPDPTTTSV